ncbi:MAG: holin [Candidatus Moraniibacteriota bacterium]
MSRTIFSKVFWKDTAERVLSSAVQGAITGFVLDQGVGQDWVNIGNVAGGMAVLTLLKCLAVSQIGDPDSASLVK